MSVLESHLMRQMHWSGPPHASRKLQTKRKAVTDSASQYRNRNSGTDKSPQHTHNVVVLEVHEVVECRMSNISVPVTNGEE